MSQNAVCKGTGSAGSGGAEGAGSSGGGCATASLTVLGSGSSGNATLLMIERPGRAPLHVMIDAGLSPRETAKRLEQQGMIGLGEIDAILLTHLDQDHFRPSWNRASVQHDIVIHCSRRHYRRTGPTRGQQACIQPFDGRFVVHDDVVVEPVFLAHDSLGSIGYLLDTGSLRIGFVTDCGRISHELIDCFTDLDALAIESNYDPAMQRASSRPTYLKNRVMGGRGHLSNAQALDAVRRIARVSPRLMCIVLLHLSRECNCPQLIARMYEEHAPGLRERLHLSHALEPLGPLIVRPRGEAHRQVQLRFEQAMLFS